MATFQANAAFDFNAFVGGNTLGSFFANATVTTDFATTVTFTYEPTPGTVQVLVLHGTFGDFIGNNPTTGTVTGMDYSVTGGTDFTITNANVSVPTFNYYGSTGDLLTLFGITFAGNDTVNGSSDNDTIAGGGGNDYMDGKAGADVMVGGAGNDTYIVSHVMDYAYELAGEGIDVVRASVSHTLEANVENMILLGSAATGTGNASNNKITGQGSANTLSGLDGNDTLSGKGGADTLLGGNGVDHLNGGAGIDTLTGGAGKDYFVFKAADSGSSSATADVITDFSKAQKDKIDLHGIAGLTFVGNAAFSNTAGEVHFVQNAGHTYVEADFNGDGAADFVLDLTGTINLVSTDFIL